MAFLILPAVFESICLGASRWVIGCLCIQVNVRFYMFTYMDFQILSVQCRMSENLVHLIILD